MSNHERVLLGVTLIRISVFVMYALVGAISFRRLYPRLSPFCKQLATAMLAAQVVVIFLAIPQHPSSLFDQWLWDVHEEGNIPATLASAQLALVAAATAYVAYHSARSSRVWYLCMLVGLAISAAGAIPLESNSLFCGRWDFLPLDGCHWTHHYEESLEFLGIWLVLVGLLGQLSDAAPSAGRSVRAFLLALLPIWVLLLLLSSLMPCLELPFLATPSDVQFESRLRLRGYRVDREENGFVLRLYAASRTPDYLDQGYSVHIVDQDSGAALASWDAPVAGPPEGILLAPDRDHIYRQQVALDFPPELPIERALWLTLSIWRGQAGARVPQKILSSDHATLDDEQVILQEFAPPKR